MDICTIIASNYAPFARVLAESFREHHPDATCWVLVIDDYHGRLDAANEPFELLTPGELDIPHFDRMAALYNVLELSTAVKPWLLRHLLNERGCEVVCYLDPDIQIFDSLGEIEALLREHRLVVTPHLTAPMPRDGRKPSETDILIAGSYNLGFIGLAQGPDTDALLDWWGERLETDCVVAPERGYFVDQRWMDFAPGLVPSIYVLRDPGYNVAYWNLPSREVARSGDGFAVNGSPLRFFHFSGFDPRKPQLLSKHQDRIRLGDHPVLRDLCRGYAYRLLGHDFETAARWSYTYDFLPDGTRIDAAVRLGYREAIEAGALPDSPFSRAGAHAMMEWLAAAPDGGAGPSRYLLAVRETRQDIKAAFPNVSGAEGARFVAWAQTFGRTELPIPPVLVPGAEPGANGAAPAGLGVNVAGYFRSVLGVGEAARQVVDALQAAGTPVSPVGLVASRSRQEVDLGPGEGPRGDHPVNLICVNADVLPAFATEVGPDFFTGRYSIGLWWWEVSKFPDQWLPAFDHVDEVWAGSRHVADALAPVSPVPVVHIVQPVVVADPEPMSRADLGVPGGFLFLFSFDYNSVFERKNPLAVVEAFTKAFAPGSGASLVLKSINHEHDERNHERLRQAVASHPDVHLIDRYVAREERDALTVTCDCYVSLHRAEGFGFTVAEAMALGRPVISTAYAGTMDFTTPANSYLVDYELVPIGPAVEPYPAEGEWAEPDVAHAAAMMREVFDHPEEAAEKGRRARADIRERHSLEAAGRVMTARIARAVGGFRTGGRGTQGPGAFDATPLRERVSQGPITPASYRFGVPQRAARKALLRGLKPYTAHARSVDAGLLQGLEAVNRGLQSLTDRFSDQSMRWDAQAARIDAQAARMDDLVGQVDRLRHDLDVALRYLSAFGVGDPAAHSEAVGPWPEAPLRPWTPEYVERHREFVMRALDDPAVIAALRAGRELPAGFGVGFDERVVEFPWTVTRDLTGRVLDAGSTLNHPHVIVRIRPRVDELDIVTLAPEPQSFPFLDISYLFADLRELPIRDGIYDRVVSISTLEHVGMDNTQYGDEGPRSSDPSADVAQAMAEMRRVLKPDGKLFITVPYGAKADLGWQRVFDIEGLDEIIDAFGPSEQRREFFHYTAAGWQRSDPQEAADAVYRDHFAESESEPPPDRAVAARAIACVELRP